MSEETKTITFQFTEDEKIIFLDFIAITRPYVDVRTIIQQYPKGCMLFIKHKFQQTQLIAYGTEAFIIQIFDGKGKVTSLKEIKEQLRTTFSMFVAEPFILIAPSYNISEFKDVLSLEITNQDDQICKNKFGIYEDRTDQCFNNTCNCEGGCDLEDMMLIQDLLLHEYKTNALKAERKAK